MKVIGIIVILFAVAVFFHVARYCGPGGGIMAPQYLRSASVRALIGIISVIMFIVGLILLFV